ncbi:MAG TPA: PAS domain S-box protein, partial [Anaeromyxobacteraceae bacterium]|nr:PAS domain S-box protein [Anaeromyxobacteraceae bacterium]
MTGTQADSPAQGRPDGRLAGTTIHPPSLEAEFRASTLRDDGRTAAVVVGVFQLFALPFILNDIFWAQPVGRLPVMLAARAVFFASAVAVVVLGLRTRRPASLDRAVLVNALVGAALMVLFQSTRPPDYFLPVAENVMATLLVLAVIPNRFSLQLLAGTAVMGGTVIWVVAFRERPPRPVALLVGSAVVLSFLTGVFVSWRLHRARRLQFLALREQAAVAERLRESESLFRTAFDNASIGKALTAPSGRFIRVNSALCEMLGYREDELVGRNAMDVTHPDDRAASGSASQAMIAGSPPVRLTKRYVRKDGRDVVAEVSLSLVRDADGTPRHFIAGVLDVTAQRESEAALAATRSRYAELYEGLGDGLSKVDGDGRYVEWNEVFRRMLGYEADEMPRLNYHDVTPARWHEEERRILEEGARAGRVFVNYEKEYRRKDGSVFPAELRVFFERREAGPPWMWAIVRDITEARKLRDQLAVASRLAAMGTLVAGVAHEINNPLGGAIASHGFVAEEVERLRDRLRADAPFDREAAAAHLDEVVDALADAAAGEQRVAAIVKDLTLLGRPDARRTRVSPARAVESSMRWLPADLLQRADVTIEDGCAPDVSASEG